MKKIDTIGSLTGQKLFIEKLAAGFNPDPKLHPLDLWHVYKYGKLPKKLKKLHNIYTLR